MTREMAPDKGGDLAALRHPDSSAFLERPVVALRLQSEAITEGLAIELRIRCVLSAQPCERAIVLCDERHLAEPLPPSAVRVLLAGTELPPARDLLQAHVVGIVLTHEAGVQDVLDAVRTVAEGRVYFPIKVFEALQSDLIAPGPRTVLTAREIEILADIAEGCANKQIAHRRHLSTSTVKSHVHKVLMKLEVSSRNEAVAKGRLLGLLPRRQ